MAIVNVTLDFNLSVTTKNPSDIRLLQYSSPVFSGSLVINQSNMFEPIIKEFSLDVGMTGRKWCTFNVELDEIEKEIPFTYMVKDLKINVDGFYPLDTGVETTPVKLGKEREDNNFVILVERSLEPKPLAVVRHNLIQQIVNEAEIKENEISDVKNILDKITHEIETYNGRKKITWKRIPQYINKMIAEINDIKGKVKTLKEQIAEYKEIDASDTTARMEALDKIDFDIL